MKTKSPLDGNDTDKNSLVFSQMHFSLSILKPFYGMLSSLVLVKLSDERIMEEKNPKTDK